MREGVHVACFCCSREFAHTHTPTRTNGHSHCEAPAPWDYCVPLRKHRLSSVFGRDCYKSIIPKLFRMTVIIFATRLGDLHILVSTNALWEVFWCSTSFEGMHVQAARRMYLKPPSQLGNALHSIKSNTGRVAVVVVEFPKSGGFEAARVRARVELSP